MTNILIQFIILSEHCCWLAFFAPPHQNSYIFEKCSSWNSTFEMMQYQWWVRQLHWSSPWMRHRVWEHIEVVWVSVQEAFLWFLTHAPVVNKSYKFSKKGSNRKDRCRRTIMTKSQHKQPAYTFVSYPSDSGDDLDKYFLNMVHEIEKFWFCLVGVNKSGEKGKKTQLRQLTGQVNRTLLYILLPNSLLCVGMLALALSSSACSSSSAFMT